MKNAGIPIIAFLTLAGCIASSAADTPSDDRYEAHVNALGETVPHGFHIVVEKPFVVIGNQSKREVERRARGTVRWAVRRLKKDFFPKGPDPIIDIWLFKDAATYRYYAEQLFGDSPDTPYGYYSELHRALIMNISTGGGTLVHEIVHPFVAANFPNCPPLVQRGARIPVRAFHRPKRPNTGLDQLAAHRAEGRHPKGRGPLVQGAHRPEREPVLQ